MNISLKAQKRIKIIFCCIVALPFLISLLNALLFTSGVNTIKEGHNRIEREYSKHSNYVINRINETRKMMDNLEDSMKRGQYSTELDRDTKQHEIDRKGQEIHAKYREQYIKIFEEQKYKLEDIKKQLRDSGIADDVKEYTKFKEYKREVMNTVEAVLWMFSSNIKHYSLIEAFTKCKKYEPSTWNEKYYCIQDGGGEGGAGYAGNNDELQERLSRYKHLKEKLGEIYLINNERGRENKAQVLLKEIRRVHFAHIDEDYNVRYGSTIPLSGLKTLSPYKGLLLEILEAQKHFEVKKVDNVTGKLIPDEKYQSLNSNTDIAVFIQLLKEYKDFGVKEND